MGRFPIPEGYRYDKYMKKVLRIKEIDDPDGEHIIRVDYFNVETCSYTHEEFVLPRVQWGSFEEKVEPPKEKPIESKRTKWLKVGAAALGMLGFLSLGGIMLSQVLDGQDDAKPKSEVSGSASFTDPFKLGERNTKTPPQTYSPLAMTNGGGTLILKNDGTLCAVGREDQATFLGAAANSYSVLAEPTPIYYGVKSVQAYDEHVVIIDKDGFLKIWGESNLGMMGSVHTKEGFVLSDKNDQAIQVENCPQNPMQYSAGGFMTASLDKEGRLYTVGRTNLQNVTGVKQVSAGGDGGYFGTVFVIKEDNSLWGVGQNTNGEVGIGVKNSVKDLEKIMDNVVYVNTAVSTTCAIREDGSLWVWGTLGGKDPSDINTYKSPTFMDTDVVYATCGYDTVYYIKADGTMWGVGRSLFFENNEEPYAANQYITSGSVSPVLLTDKCVFVAAEKGVNGGVVVVKSDGTAWAIGYKGLFGEKPYDDYVYTKFTQIADNVMLPEKNYPGVEVPTKFKAVTDADYSQNSGGDQLPKPPSDIAPLPEIEREIQLAFTGSNLSWIREGIPKYSAAKGYEIAVGEFSADGKYSVNENSKDNPAYSENPTGILANFSQNGNWSTYSGDFDIEKVFADTRGPLRNADSYDNLDLCLYFKLDNEVAISEIIIYSQALIDAREEMGFAYEIYSESKSNYQNFYNKGVMKILSLTDFGGYSLELRNEEDNISFMWTSLDPSVLSVSASLYPGMYETYYVAQKLSLENKTS